MKVWKNPEVALPITRQEFIDLGLPEESIEKGEYRGELKTFGPWHLPVSYRALAISVVWVPKERARYSAEAESTTAYGMRTMSKCRQEGYELEGRVSVNGKSHRAFTSTQLFDVEGKLVNVATIHVCMKGDD